MGKLLRCRDLGLDCPHETTGQSAEEVLQKAYAHALVKHPDLRITPELVEQARAALKDV